jgi:quercetin dioxygenase-like cupin family protein
MDHPACSPLEPGEVHERYAGYLESCPAGDLREILAAQRLEWISVWGRLADEAGDHRYAPGKWSVASLLAHVADTELVFWERALRAARGDESPQPGFSEDSFAASFRPRLDQERDRLLGQRREIQRWASGLADEAWLRRGHVADRHYSVRGLLRVLVGHAAHHLAIYRERYLPGLPAPTPASALRCLPGQDAEPVLEQPGIRGWRLGVDGERRLVRVVLEPGVHLPPHPVPDRALFWVVRGVGELEVDGVVQVMLAGDAALVEGGAQRGWRNTGDGPLELHVVRGWPEHEGRRMGA